MTMAQVHCRHFAIGELDRSGVSAMENSIISLCGEREECESRVALCVIDCSACAHLWALTQIT